MALQYGEGSAFYVCGMNKGKYGRYKGTMQRKTRLWEFREGMDVDVERQKVYETSKK